MFHLIGWQESQDEGGVLLNEAACTDSSVTVQGDVIYVPEGLNKLGAEYVYGGSLATAARLRSPSMRAKVEQQIVPIDLSITPGKEALFRPHFDNLIELTPGEGLEGLLNANPAAAEVHTILAWLFDAAPAPVQGEIMSVGVTATITSVVGAWVNGALTFDQTLPRGRYAVVGASFWEADLLAFRFRPVGQATQPGGIGVASIGTADRSLFRYGQMGVWFEFDSLTPPTLEILNAAAAAQSVAGIIDLIKVG